MMGLGCTLCGREEPWVDVVQEEGGSYRATICGHFTLPVKGRPSLSDTVADALPAAFGSAGLPAGRTPHP